MHKFVKSFLRAADGTWICIRKAEVTLLHGRLKALPGDEFLPGQMVFGVAIAELMDHQCDVDVLDNPPYATG